jgi:hypothetical protein
MFLSARIVSVEIAPAERGADPFLVPSTSYVITAAVRSMLN